MSRNRTEVAVLANYDSFFIGGEWSPALSRERLQIYSATTEEVIGSVPAAMREDVDAAVAAARRCLDAGEWRGSSADTRAGALRRFATALDARRPALTTTVSMQNGMPVSLSRFLEGKFPVNLLNYYAEIADDLELEERRTTKYNDTLVRRNPVGVVAAIIPWNYPVTLAISKVAPAIAAGCAVVLKPAPGTVLDSYLVAEAAEEAQLPPGLLNWVYGDRDIGEYLVTHPQVDRVAFTGSTAAGRRIAELCGRLLRPVSLELGGKSAAIVLDDVELDGIGPALFAATLANNGQTCVSCSRVLAPRSRYTEVVDALADLLDSARVGDALDPDTQVGPLASSQHRQRVEGFIATGLTEGARLVTGGGRPAGLDRGWFVEPTLFADVDNRATIGQQEIFGPVLSVIAYDDEEDAVRLANDSAYGLGGTVWSADPDRAAALARRVDTGTVGINGYAIDPNSPFGGVKASGLGREFGPEAVDEYQQVQSLYLAR
jgi:acyl-CoA reductase-like NAD-dependent aldehyde dehydrogenase